MTRLRPILAAIALAATRGARSLRHVSGNNLVYAGVTLTFMLDPGAMVFLLTLIAIVLFLPSSSDPLTAVPRDRIELWPLHKWELRALRLLTPFLNPLTWLILATLVWKRLQWGLWAALATAFLTGFLSSHLRLPPSLTSCARISARCSPRSMCIAPSSSPPPPHTSASPASFPPRHTSPSPASSC